MPTMSAISELVMPAPVQYGLSGVTESFMCVAVVLVVLRVELYRRAHTGPNLGSRQGIWYMESCKRILRECAPEAAGLLVVFTVAAVLRARGDGAPPGEAANEAWEEIKRQWPLLMTADTLLSLQAMFRLLILVSVTLRVRAGMSDNNAKAPVPLAEESALIWLMAGLARVTLLTRSKVYMLDGPVGGHLPSVCEILGLAPLLVLSVPALRRAPIKFTLVLMAAGFFASRHRLSLSDDWVSDSLWTLAHSCDFFMSFAYLLRTLLIDNLNKSDGSVGFTHLVMAVQQGFSAYYFLTAFDDTPELVGTGLPFHVLKIGGLAQLGAYLGAIAVYVAECYVESSEHDDSGASAPATGATLDASMAN